MIIHLPDEKGLLLDYDEHLVNKLVNAQYIKLRFDYRGNITDISDSDNNLQFSLVTPGLLQSLVPIGESEL